MITISPSDNMFDSRDIMERLDDLQEGDLDEVEAEELRVLESFVAEAEQCVDWEYGVTFIRDSHFADYAEELASDIGAVDRDNQWPLMHIDWDAAANDLKTDYSPIEFDNVTYWVRS